MRKCAAERDSDEARIEEMAVHFGTVEEPHDNNDAGNVVTNNGLRKRALTNLENGAGVATEKNESYKL